MNMFDFFSVDRRTMPQQNVSRNNMTQPIPVAKAVSNTAINMQPQYSPGKRKRAQST